MEGERVKMEREVIGDVGEVDCHISFGTSMDGSRIIIDGWVMPAIEVQRVVDARNAHLELQDYFSSENGDSYEPIHPAELRSVSLGYFLRRLCTHFCAVLLS